jgi:hypothetical protein
MDEAKRKATQSEERLLKCAGLVTLSGKVHGGFPPTQLKNGCIPEPKATMKSFFSSPHA